MNNPIKSLTRREWCLWLASLAVVLIANQITPELDPLTMTAALVGVTSLVFAAKGNVWSQVLMIVFSILFFRECLFLFITTPQNSTICPEFSSSYRGCRPRRATSSNFRRPARA